MKPFYKILVILLLISIFGTLGDWIYHRFSSPVVLQQCPRFLSDEKTNASSQNCATCHVKEFEGWREGLHAKANRERVGEQDREAYEIKNHPALHEIKLKVDWKSGTPEMRGVTPFNAYSYHGKPEMVIGSKNVIQYLIPFSNGRWQVAEPAYDPHRKEWFSIFEGEKRRPEEWGHWSNRGMNWNSNCASCHMTGFNRGYDVSSDSYHSTWNAQAIQCASCHSSQRANPQVDHSGSSREKLSVMNRCAACHSRREAITEKEDLSQSYNDQYRLELLSQAGLYYPDGQIRDEVFEWGSFQMSKMGHAGVSCMECHDAHSGDLRAPIENNALCLTCHGATTRWNAPQIQPESHSHHASGSLGNRCVSCHMPETIYMKRDPRRDHGFVVPDPQMTKELGIPNACNRCHQNEGVDKAKGFTVDKDIEAVNWAIEKTESWYGDRMRRPERERTRAIARAYQGDRSVVGQLVEIGRKEKIATWRATLLDLANQLNPHDQGVRMWRAESIHDGDPVVRRVAIEGCDPFPEEWELVRLMLQDPVRSVRVAAASVLRREIDLESRAGRELIEWIDLRRDQPSGALRKALFHESRGEDRMAEKEFQRVVDLDPASSTGYHEWARYLATKGRLPEAFEILVKAIPRVIDPQQLQFDAALVEVERGELKAAEKRLNLLVKKAPNFGRAWYNLGLLRNQLGDKIEGAKALKRAQELDGS